MRTLITGGAGFIGSHLVERLLSLGHEIIVLDDFNDYYPPALKRANLAAVESDVEILTCDIRDSASVDKAFARSRPEAVIHLAARAGVRPSISDPKLYFTTNIAGTFNLLEACRSKQVQRFIFASSSSVYGVNEKVPFAESDPILRTISPYAATKLAGEQVCSNYAHLFGIRATCLRLFTAYGPRQRPDLAICKFARRILQGRPIPKFGDGESARDYTFVDDIIDGMVAALAYDGEDFDIFNLGGSSTTTLNQLIELLEEALGRQALIEVHPKQAGDVPRTFADISKATKLLGYRPQVAVEDGISRYIAWLDEQPIWRELETDG